MQSVLVYYVSYTLVACLLATVFVSVNHPVVAVGSVIAKLPTVFSHVNSRTIPT